MAGLIPQSFIDNLLARTDIVEVVSDRITLKKAGRNHQALCPFHKEKSPSFSVSQDKQFYYCFGCGASGNAVGFVMDFDHIGFPEAVELLARTSRSGSPTRRWWSAESVNAMTRFTKFWKSLLNGIQISFEATATPKPPLATISRQRGLDGRIAKHVPTGLRTSRMGQPDRSIGFSTPERSQLLLDGGLVVENEERKSTYDRFP